MKIKGLIKKSIETRSNQNKTKVHELDFYKNTVPIPFFFLFESSMSKMCFI